MHNQQFNTLAPRLSSTLAAVLGSMLLSSCLLLPATSLAEERHILDILKPANLVKPRGKGVKPDKMVADVSENTPRLDSEAAVALVRAEYADRRILGVSMLDGRPGRAGLRGSAGIYRVRTLSKQGVVRSVFVNSDTGEVFERGRN